MADSSFWVKDLSLFKGFHFGISAAFFTKKSWTHRQSDRGYKFFAEGYIHDVFIHKNECTIKAKCYRSQKKNEKPHSLHLKFASVDLMVEAHCTCEAGNSESCNHVVGLAYFLQHLILNGFKEVPESASCTSIPMEWNKPRGNKITAEKIPESVFIDPNNIKRTKKTVICQIKNPIRNDELKKINQASITNLKTVLKEINPSIPFASTLCTENMANDRTILLQNGINVPASSLLGHMARAGTKNVAATTGLERDEHLDDLPIALPLDDKEMVDILISLAPVHHASLQPISMEQAAEIEKKTRTQNQNDLWKDLRKFRFTASKFGFVCRRKLFNDEFIKPFVCPPDISRLKTVAHGLKNEPIAIREFLKSNPQFKYFKCGLVVHPYAIHLGASPDGILYDCTSSSYGVLEVKCPCSTKADSLEEHLKIKTFCLQQDENNLLSLKVSHDYYFQIQGQMLLAGLRWAKFVVYMAKTQQIVVQTIPFDPIFCQNMYRILTQKYEIFLANVEVVRL
ncbi:unnamed protein product [Ceutorhynchus assimilis]|uniref:SWIM-type domain-containing protein n=1 Tax=Ceutorhynchus assimilis TaxID=467358 RepID=A0A9N9MV78_9CUCU|nr:unnamed protein product [Ceutorhynchus assimilis]